MTSYNDPTAYLLESPVGVDKHIQDLQIKFQKLPWLQVAFGRAFVREGERVKGKRVFYPETYQRNLEAFNVMPNDNLKSMCFFYTRDPARPLDYKFLQNNTYVYPVSVVFWVNLSAIDGTKDFRFTESLKQDVLNIFKRATNVQITDIFEDWDNVLDRFTIDNNTRQFLKPPYSGFRIDFLLSFLDAAEGC